MISKDILTRPHLPTCVGLCDLRYQTMAYGRVSRSALSTILLNTNFFGFRVLFSKEMGRLTIFFKLGCLTRKQNKRARSIRTNQGLATRVPEITSCHREVIQKLYDGSFTNELLVILHGKLWNFRTRREKY